MSSRRVLSLLAGATVVCVIAALVRLGVNGGERRDAPQRSPGGDGGGAHDTGQVLESVGEQSGTDAVLIHARALVRAAAEAAPIDDLGDSVREREIESTILWLRELIPKRVRFELRIDAARFLCASQLAPAGDDAIVVSGVLDGSEVTVIDSRVLVLAVMPGPDLDGAEAVFARFVNGALRANGTAKWHFDRLDASSGREAGTFTAERSDLPTGFSEPIIWGTGARGVNIFVFEKLRYPPPSKLPYPPEISEQYADGLAVGDPRTYRRFTDSNRRELARERFQGFVERLPVGASPAGVRDRGVGAPRRRR